MGWRNFNNKKILERGGYKFERAVETSDRIFYRAFDERIKTGTVMMMDRKMNILDTGIDAFRAFKSMIKSGSHLWLSEKMKIYLENKK